MTEIAHSSADVIAAVCEAVLPSLAPPENTAAGSALDDYYRLGAADRGLDAAVIAAIPSLAAHLRSKIAALVARLDEQGFMSADATARTALLLALANESSVYRLAFRQIKAMVLGSFVNGVDASGTNPTWPVLGYPGPASAPPPVSAIPDYVTLVEPASDPQTLSADVVVVGSGAGGAVIAARAAQAGLSVLILEAGEYRTETRLPQLDSSGASMYLRQGSLWSESGQMGILAGSVLGGGTLINSMVCLRTPLDVRRQWAAEGLTGLDEQEFDDHLDRVWTRLNVNTDETVYNNNTRAMVAGLASLGYSHERLPRNAAGPDDSSQCGYCNAGCVKGSKMSTLHTYLRDATSAGARVVVGCTVDTVIAEGGRATGVRARVRTPQGEVALTVEAPTVVVAAGGIESPALLLRSGIGGEAVGRNLRLHPAWIVTGRYEEPIEAWHGQIQSAVSFDLTKVVEGGGFLVESLGLNPGTWASNLAFTDARELRDRLRSLGHFATWHGVSHDHGSGEVVLDEEGQAAVRWSLDDRVDEAIARRAHRELARLHRAAGAREIFTFLWSDIRWKHGEDFDAFLDRLDAAANADHTSFSAHQMGTCRLGDDPRTSVADGNGQLHDVAGVWIGDASALPAAPGVNPMITIMAIAERTAKALVASRVPAPALT